jgi:zinc transport system ATP-binding protein
MASLLTLHEAVAGYARPVSPPASFALARGETLGLAGPNGAGKSTLLKAVLGTARLHGGTLVVAAGARLACLPQRPQRLAETPLSGRDLLRCLGAEDLAPPARLKEKLALRADRLSGGEYQLLCLWACLAGDADLVLLDEPTNNLDPAHARLAAEEIAAGRERRATLVVSHDRAFLDAVCSRIVTLEARGHG